MSITPIINNQTTDADGVLIAFTEAVEAGQATVAAWSERYPDLSRDFVRIAAQRLGDVGVAPDPEQLARLERAGQAARQNLRARYFVTTPLVALVDRERGLTAAVIAERIALPITYVAKLQQRLFAPESLPRTLVERLADTVGRTVEEMHTFLAAPPALARAAAYRADGAPVVGEPEDFQAALAADDAVSPETRAIYREG